MQTTAGNFFKRVVVGAADAAVEIADMRAKIDEIFESEAKARAAMGDESYEAFAANRDLVDRHAAEQASMDSANALAEANDKFTASETARNTATKEQIALEREMADVRKRAQDTYSPPSPAEMDAFREAERQEAEKRERQALFLWREAQPIGGTIAETYLRGRGITCDLPDTLRFHPASWHATAQRLPTMLALIEGLPRQAVHRTYLRQDGSGKADVEPAKAMLGAAAGGAVRLTVSQGRWWWPRA